MVHQYSRFLKVWALGLIHCRQLIKPAEIRYRRNGYKPSTRYEPHDRFAEVAVGTITNRICCGKTFALQKS